MASLSNPKGITSTSVIDIPDVWSADWFRRFIRTQLSQADVRNANAGAGIQISGNPTVPATIAASTDLQALFKQPYVLVGSPVAPAALTDYRSIAAQSGVLSLVDGGAAGSLTISVAANGIGNTQLRQGAALSVIGNSGNAPTNVADIVAGADGQLLRRTGTAIGFGTVTLADTTGLGAAFVTSGLTTGQVLRATGATTAAFAAIQVGDLPTVNETHGGTNQTGYALGDTLYASATNTLSRLAGNVAATRKFLRQLGTGTVSAAPAWDTLVSGDIPTLGANPSAVVGLTAVNGSASTYLRSDASPALDQTIAPTWSGMHTFSAQETRKAFDTAFLSFYNSANSTRTGYLQLSATGTSFINVEIAQALNIRTSNTDRVSFLAGGGMQIITTVGFNNTAPIAKPTVTGSKASNAALASLLTALASYGLVTDSST